LAVKILVVDDDQNMTRFLTLMLEREGYTVVAAHSVGEGLEAAGQHTFDVVVTDLKMPDGDGIKVLEGVREIDAAVPVVIMTGNPSQRSAIDALNRGAFQYIEKNAKNEEIRLVVQNAIQMRRIQSQNLVLKKQLKETALSREILGRSEEIQKVLRLVEKVSDTEATVLIHGESGTGKELIARKIHEQSSRSGTGPFLAINCGALPKDLLESTLFGHIKGSFTGAIKDQVGHSQAAENGSLFLDEIGDTTPATQVKLLRAIQEREVIRVGGTEPVKVNTRLIAATNRDLEEEVRGGNFRMDLYYRLNVIQIKLPPLRARRDDIPLLVGHFLKKLTDDDRQVSRDAMEVLMGYDWPGNVRELENVIERAIILGDGGTIDVDDLPDRVVRGESPRGSMVIDTPELTLDELEKAYILRVLEHTGWHKKKASAILGINASTLYRKLQGYSLTEELDRRKAA